MPPRPQPRAASSLRQQVEPSDGALSGLHGPDVAKRLPCRRCQERPSASACRSPFCSSATTQHLPGSRVRLANRARILSDPTRVGLCGRGSDAPRRGRAPATPDGRSDRRRTQSSWAGRDDAQGIEKATADWTFDSEGTATPRRSASRGALSSRCLLGRRRGLGNTVHDRPDCYVHAPEETAQARGHAVGKNLVLRARPAHP